MRFDYSNKPVSPDTELTIADFCDLLWAQRNLTLGVKNQNKIVPSAVALGKRH
jgi:hypothetical protein